MQKGKRAEATAEYLEQVQWGASSEKIPDKVHPDKVIEADLNINTAEITKAELDDIIRSMKGNKAPGPDRAVSELYKWLDEGNRNVFREMLNECWRSHAYHPVS